MSKATKWLAGTNALLGLWLVVAPFVFEAPVIDLWNDVLVGVAIVGLAGYGYYRKRNTGSVSQSAAWLNALLGLWLIAAPFVFGVTGALLWSDVLVGLTVGSLATYNDVAAHRVQSTNAVGTA